MTKSIKTNHRSALTFGDLVLAVSSSSRNSREATAAIEDLLRRGRVGISSRRARLQPGSR